MRLENVLALTYGKLINKPFVNNFNDIVFDAKQVKRGDLFIASDTQTIETALLNGAYGIIFDKPAQISDIEIAWIKVENIQNAVQRLLRFKLIEKEVVVYECDEIVLKLALQVMTGSDFVAVSGAFEDIFGQLWHIEKNATILFCPALSGKEIFTDIKKMPTTLSKRITIMEQTLFETSFIYNDTFYERQLISPFFIPYLEELLNLLSSLKIEYRLKKFTPLEHFQALFTNKKFEIKEFGTSDKVLIFERNSSLIKKEIEFLQNNASWAKTIYVVPHDCQYKSKENVFEYKNEKDVKSILKENDFHFALMVGLDVSILNKPLIKQTQLTIDF